MFRLMKSTLSVVTCRKCLCASASSSSEELETKSSSIISLSQMYDMKEPSVSSVTVKKQGPGPAGAAPPTSGKATKTAESAKESTSERNTLSSAEEEEEEEEEQGEESVGTLGILQIKESIVKLWSYNYPVTVGRNVSCMVWSRTNPVNI